MFTYQTPPRQAMELRWTMLGVSFRVMPSFFLITAILAYFFIGRFIIEAILIDVACIFFAVVFTEFIQGLVYRSYGIRSTVVVQDFFGGIYPDREPDSRLQRIMVALASPISCFMLLALVQYTNDEWKWAAMHPYASFAYFILWIVALVWGIIGLLPIFPYPGGRVMLEILTYLFPRKGLSFTLQISIILGVLYCIYIVGVYLKFVPILDIPGGGFLPIGIFLGIFLLLATMKNVQLLRIVHQNERSSYTDDYGDRNPWDR